MKMIVCERCGRYRARYGENIPYCQKCYRELLEEYSFYAYKVEKKRLSGNAKKICEMIVEEGINKKEVAEMLGLNKVYVGQVVNKYLERVNSEGKKKPF